MITIKVTTRDLFDNYIAGLAELIWENQSMADMYDIHNMKHIAHEDMNEIRQLFIDRLTFILVDYPSMETIENNPTEEIEIRVFGKEGKLIGVIINSEINY